MEDKINAFATLPNDRLSKLSETSYTPSQQNNVRSIENEFNQTNQHTKQTPSNPINTDNTDNTDTNSPTTANIAKDKKNQLGKLMSGEFAVGLIDMFLPSMVVLLVHYIGYSVDKKSIQLSKDEKEALSPAVQDVLNEIEIDFNNPYINLGVMICIVYGSKVMDNIPKMKKRTREAKEAKRDIAEGLSSIVSETPGESNEVTPIENFEIEYSKLVDEIRKQRKRGVGDAKQYLAENFSEKIKAVAKKTGVNIKQIQGHLNHKHTVKKRGSEDFDLENSN